MPTKTRAPSKGTTVPSKANGYSRSGASKHPDGHTRVGPTRQVAELQRTRMLTAMVQEISERGAANVSVAHVVGRSGVSRRTFYEIFDDRDDCFLAALEDALSSVLAVVLPAYQEPAPWQARIRSALIAFLDFLEYDRPTGRLLIVESLAAGSRALERRQKVIIEIVPVIEGGQQEAKAAVDLPALTAEGIIGGALSVLHARLIDESKNSLLDLTGPLMGMIVLPYLGATAARKEIKKPAPKRAHRRPVVRTDPLQDLPMRLTYRTMRALIAVAELGVQGAYPSNRAVGEHAGIGDQGQASKLLGRLHKLGLIENQGRDPARGEANAWVLTTTGKQVHDSITTLGTGAS